MKKLLSLAIVSAGLALAAPGSASAAVAALPGDAVRTSVAPLELVEKAGWRDRRHLRRVCTWRHGRRICWWRRVW